MRGRKKKTIIDRSTMKDFNTIRETAFITGLSEKYLRRLQKEDKLPARLTEVLQDENDPKSKVPLDQMKKIYYSARGWDAQGLPKSALLKKLGIGAG